MPDGLFGDGDSAVPTTHKFLAFMKLALEWGRTGSTSIKIISDVN